MCARKRVEIFSSATPIIRHTHIMKFCSAADVCVPKTMDISSYWFSFDGYISKLSVHYTLYLYFILYLPLNPLPYLGHPMRVFLFNLFDLVNKIPHVLGEIPQNWACPVHFC